MLPRINDSQAQYSRRPCLVINSSKRNENESEDEKLVLSRLKEKTRIDEDVIQQNIDKIHRIGQPEGGKQRRIVKFTSDSFKFQLSKKLSFLMQICMGISKLYWTLSSRIGMWLALRQRKMLLKFSCLWVPTIMKGYRMRNTKGFSFLKSHWYDNPISLFNQVSVLPNSCKLSVFYYDT